VQRKSILRDVERLGGRVIEFYGGQEHGTPNWERAEVNRLLSDATRGIWDCVIVAYADRYSRDNRKSKEGLDIFRSNGIKFYIGASEQNLYDPQVRFMLGLHAEVGEFVALQQNKKSMESRIERARQGRPSVGSKPWGRLYDKDTGTWSIDPEKKAAIEDIARRYLSGARLQDLHRLYSQYFKHLPYLYKTLHEQTGDTWVVRFSNESLNIDETITIAVPPLLDKVTLQRVKARMASHYQGPLHGHPHKHKYLLGGYVYCAACGNQLIGSPEGRRGKCYLYYKHSAQVYRRCPLTPKPQVPVVRWDPIVISRLFDMLGNPSAIQRAVRDSVPSCDKEMQRRKKLIRELGGVKAGIDRIIGAIGKGLISSSEAERQLGNLRERQSLLQVEVNRLDEILASIPSEEQMSCYLERVERARGWSLPGVPLPDAITVIDGNSGELVPGGNDLCTYLGMSWEDKRQLVEAVFEGTVGGKPAGVYFMPIPGGVPYQPRLWTFKLLGKIDFESLWFDSQKVKARMT
jgi:DNA invertase Pin-like site-specific DNA recombinase